MTWRRGYASLEQTPQPLLTDVVDLNRTRARLEGFSLGPLEGAGPPLPTKKEPPANNKKRSEFVSFFGDRSEGVSVLETRREERFHEPGRGMIRQACLSTHSFLLPDLFVTLQHSLLFSPCLPICPTSRLKVLQVWISLMVKLVHFRLRCPPSS